MYKIIIIFLFNLFSIYGLNAQLLVFKNEATLIAVGSKISYYEDISSTLKFEQVGNQKFNRIISPIPNFGNSSSTFWIKLRVKNTTKEKKLILNLAAPTIDNIDIYVSNDSDKYVINHLGEEFPFNQRTYLDPNFLIDLDFTTTEVITIYMKIRSKEAIQLPIYLGTKEAVFNQIKNRDILSGIYVGIMLVMIFYNLFIYFSVKDKSYIYYVIYIVLILLTQTSLQGYPFQYLWPSFPKIAQYSLFILPSLVGIASLLFMNVFLRIKDYNVRLFRFSYVFSTIYTVSILLSFFNLFKFSFIVMEFNAGLVSIFMLYTSIYIIKKGYQPAKYFLAAWSVFLLGVVIYILKDFEVLPFNNFTRYTMQIGSGIETVLLSFALAARINIYKKERLEALVENQKLISEQNVILEQKVELRTEELNQTLSHLKQTQSKLVDAEKMASLGQLTAGIAHEVNNPINFIASNIFPLRADINDLKTILNKYTEIKTATNLSEKLIEIEQLKEELQYEYLLEELEGIIHGIEDGAKRTAEIVSGLRNFSRLDEGSLKFADINEGIESTLSLIKNKLGTIKLTKNLAKLPKIECFPGKINQLILNLLDNAIYAVNAKKSNPENKEVKISTLVENDSIVLIIKDNGVGMDEKTKQRLFEPFYTTKDVGEGTGLGLSIVHGIIQSHKAKIELISELNLGTEFKIYFPLLN